MCSQESVTGTLPLNHASDPVAARNKPSALIDPNYSSVRRIEPDDQCDRIVANRSG